MRRLSVAGRPVQPRDGVRTVATDQRLERGAVIANLSRLVSKSLVAAEFRDPEVEYRLLDLDSRLCHGEAGRNGRAGSKRGGATPQLCIDCLGEATADIERLPRTEWLVALWRLARMAFAMRCAGPLQRPRPMLLACA